MAHARLGKSSRARAAGLLAAVAVLLSACGGGEREAARSTSAPAPAGTEPPAETAPPASAPAASASAIPDSLPFRFDFGESPCPLPEGVEPAGESVCADGVYRMSRTDDGFSGTRAHFDPDVFAVTVEVDVLPTAGAAAYGVSCWQLFEGYHLVVAADGSYAILREKPGERVLLASGVDPEAAQAGGAGRIRGECRGGRRGGADSATLVLSLNGRQLAEVGDPEPPRSFKGIVFGAFGLSVFPAVGATWTTVEFDNLTARGRGNA
ncbi:MAG TPA: hypothetical protein VD769_06405 [Gaiellaceae bacterium]|nr:hypothetical protein [Gaiellaceae bacterium]